MLIPNSYYYRAGGPANVYLYTYAIAISVFLSGPYVVRRTVPLFRMSASFLQQRHFRGCNS